MLTQAWKFLPALTAIRCFEYRCVLHTCIHGIRIFERGLQMPDFFELPSLERPIVTLMRSQLADVVKVFANASQVSPPSSER